MEIFIRGTVLSLILAMSCRIFYDTIADGREWRHSLTGGTVLPAFLLAFFFIAFTEIPPYLFQPVRMIAAVFIVAQIYYRIRPLQNLLLSTLFCALIWIIQMFASLLIYILYGRGGNRLWGMDEILCYGLLLCLMLLFQKVYKGRDGIRAMAGESWGSFICFPVFSIIVSVALSMLTLDGGREDGNIMLIVTAGFWLINLVAFDMMENILAGRAKAEKMRLSAERNRNQMEIYRSLQQGDECRKRQIHDYKNQLNCIRGLVDDNRTKEALRYIGQLTGSLSESIHQINTGHPVVNVLLNQKYQSAREQQISMTMTMNNLSELSLSEEDIVTLLANLLDNAIEACLKLHGDRRIQLKMVMEEEELFLSIRNPVEWEVKISGKTAAAAKEKSGEHGLGLGNVDAVIRKNRGRSTLQCQEGWFCVTAVILQPQR